MPTVLREAGYRFHFFSNENAEPRHIHVARAGAEAKFWIDPVALASSSGFAMHELTRIRRIVMSRRAMLGRAWDEYFASRD